MKFLNSKKLKKLTNDWNVTDQQDGSQVFEEAGAQQNSERWRREAGILATPPGGRFPMQNVGTVNFEPPTVPVIFVLGEFTPLFLSLLYPSTAS